MVVERSPKALPPDATRDTWWPRGVPVVRRNLLAEPRRLAGSVVGVGLAVMLILLLDGLWSGLRQQSTVYPDRVGADLYLLQPGVRDLTAGAGTVALGTLDTVRADPAVSWAAPVRSAYLILTLHGRKVAVYVVGSVPDLPGGPWSLASGRAPLAEDEVTVGALVARRHGVVVGDLLAANGRRLRVVGTSRSTGFMLDHFFVTHSALAQLTGAPASTTSFVLVGTDQPEAAARRLRADGLNVLTREQVAANNVATATGIIGSPMRIMVGIGLAAGTLIIALTAYTAILERRREYGIIKALGATRGRLVRLALAQTVALAALGLGAGLVLFVAGRLLIHATWPQFSVALTPGAAGRTAGAALAMALIAAVLPARRLAALEPATAYRSPT
jgi:putative ABC transport system permease protein